MNFFFIGMQYDRYHMLACMDVLDDQIKYNAKKKTITPLVTHCKVRIKIQLHFSTHYTCI